MHDPANVGAVFLVQVDPLESPEVYGDKRAHWIVVIDVAGETSDESLVYVPAPTFDPPPALDPLPHSLNRGWQFHLGADPTSRKVNFLNSRIDRKRSASFIRSVEYVGKIQNEFHPGQPGVWVYQGLVPAMSAWYEDFTEHSTKKWSAEVNCQTFACEIIQRLSLDVPSSVTLISDIEPHLLVDLGIFVHTVV